MLPFLINQTFFGPAHSALFRIRYKYEIGANFDRAKIFGGIIVPESPYGDLASQFDESKAVDLAGLPVRTQDEVKFVVESSA